MTEITGTMAAQVLHEKMQELKARNVVLEAVLAAARAALPELDAGGDKIANVRDALAEAIRLCDSQEDGK